MGVKSHDFGGRRRRWSLLPLLCFLAAGPASADVIFTDQTFNLANYTQTASFTVLASLASSQCASCGNPGSALQITATFGDTTVNAGSADVGFVNNTFSYNPSTQGPLASIAASVDKDLSFNVTSTTVFGNTFRPLIEQDGNFYLAAIAGPGLLGGSTGFQTLSGTLVASDFQRYDFSTGTFLAGTPNFAGDPMLFGIGQIFGVAGFQSSQATAVYDNLKLDLQPVPEPSSSWLFGGALALVAILGRRWPVFRRRPIC